MKSKLDKKPALQLIFLACLLTSIRSNHATRKPKETEEAKASSNASTYFEGSILVDSMQRPIQTNTLKTELQNLQNQIEFLKFGQQRIENLLTALANEFLPSDSSSSSPSSPSPSSSQIDEHLKYYDEHLNCLQNCTTSTSTKGRAENCADVMPEKNYQFGIYLLNLPQSSLPPFFAYCRLFEDKSWTIIQRRYDGSVNFYRNWHDYKNGFGDLYGEYWLGLVRLYAMTKARDYELWIQLSDFDYKDKTLYYGKFAVGSEEEGFALTIGDYIGDIEDSLRFNNGRKFSTYDHYEHENIYNRMNCAQTFKGAWWYYDCFGCSLNGEYYSHSNRKTRYGIFWRDWHGYESLRSVHMAIRAVN